MKERDKAKTLALVRYTKCVLHFDVANELSKSVHLSCETSGSAEKRQNVEKKGRSTDSGVADE